MTNLLGANLNNGSAVGPQGEGWEGPSRFPQYPEYKDSGVEWLGAVPGDWVVRKVSVDFSATKGPRGALLTKEYCHENSGEYPVYSGQTENGGILGKIADFDFDLGKDGAILSTTVGAKAMSVSYITGRVSLSQNCMIIKSISRNISIKFFFYHFQPLFSLERRMIPDHMQPSFRMEDLYSFRIAVPPEKEQTQIARFLDHETARLDALIEEQQRLIELLKEKRQSVISHAVTKGLDPTVPLKDSGVEWLGEVPAHWVLEPLKYQCRFSGGGTPSKENLEYWNGDIPWVSPKDMKTFWITDTEDKVTAAAVTESSTNMVEPGALLLVVRSGILQRTIPTGINTVALSLNQDMKALRFFVEGMAEFVAFIIKGFEPSILLEWRKQGATVESIEHEYLANTTLAVPPLIELKAIVQKLRETEAKYEVLQDESMHLIAMLQERRFALISAAVTGKIDVRGWQLPASAQTPELVQEAV